MIHKDNGQCELECDKDGCKKTFGPYPAKEFKDMIADARRDGWVVFMRDGVWKHFCDWVHS